MCVLFVNLVISNYFLGAEVLGQCSEWFLFSLTALNRSLVYVEAAAKLRTFTDDRDGISKTSLGLIQSELF